MVYAVLSIFAVFFCFKWQKSKAEISFFEGKAADFLERELRWMRELEEMRQQRSQGFIEIPITSEFLVETEVNAASVYEHPSISKDSVGNELKEVELGNVSLAFLKKIGVSIEDVEVTNDNTYSSIEMIHEQVCLFEEAEVSEITSFAPSLDVPGLHYWDGTIIQKYSDDFVLVTNGTYQYHLSHEKLGLFQPDDSICLQVLVSESLSRSVIMVWRRELAVSA